MTSTTTDPNHSFQALHRRHKQQGRPVIPAAPGKKCVRKSTLQKINRGNRKTSASYPRYWEEVKTIKQPPRRMDDGPPMLEATTGVTPFIPYERTYHKPVGYAQAMYENASKFYVRNPHQVWL